MASKPPDWSIATGLEQEASPEEYLPHFHALKYSCGDRVEVWSNGKSCWLPAKVESVWLEDTVAEGYSIAMGTVKVVSAAGAKWIVPEHVSVHLRKVPGGAPAGGSPAMRHTASGSSAASPAMPERTPGYPSSPSGAGSDHRVRLCRNKCGRPVQPGMTRSLKLYDTCCKRCAEHPGKEMHDDNCGPARRLGGSSASPDAHLVCKRQLESLLQDPALLSQSTAGIFKHFAGHRKELGIPEVGEGVRTLMWSLFHFKQDVSDDFLEYINGLHPDVDVLGFEQFTYVCRVCLEEKQRIWFPELLPVTTRNFVKKNTNPLEEVYKLGRKLGQGTFGEVYEATHLKSGETRVCKRIMKSSKTSDHEQVLREIGNMAMLDHPNVIKVYEYFDDESCVSQIMEQCQGGELQDHIDRYRKTARMPYDEAFICDVMKQTLRALAFMHKKPCMHKDLKPQNIMLVDSGSSSVKVIDFGLAELFMPTQEFAKSPGGTLLYMAPEVFKQAMTVKIDVWAAGVILYNLLTADFPFMEAWPPPKGKDAAWWQQSTIRIIRHGELAKNERLKGASPECLDLLSRMLRKSADERPDATLCLEHPWFQKFCEVPPPLSVGVVQCIEGYARMSELKKALFLLIAHQSALEAVEELRALFTHFDFRNQGSLSAADLHHVLVQSGMAGLRAERVMHGLDRVGNGVITWTEFMAAAICGAVSRSQKNTGVDAAFAAIDTDNDGKINAEDIVRIFAGREGEHSVAWREKGQIEDVLSIETAHPVRAMKAIWDVTKKVLGSEQAATKDQFRKFICQVMAFRPGDGFFAVS